MLDTAPADPLVGSLLADRYEVVQRLGEGGMGSVYAGRHVQLNKRVALKVLKKELLAQGELVERFLREARATASIGHENIIDIIDVHHDPGGMAFFAMELLEGQELEDLIRGHGRLPWARTRDILVQVMRALGAAHGAGIVHRDMKPANVYLVERSGNPDYVKVLDFGIAKIEQEVGLTQAGMVFGTADYMAPEQATGGEVDGRTDIYALGCVMFRMLTGRLPFTDAHPVKVVRMHISEPVPQAREAAPDAGISAAVEELLLKAMAKFPDQRFADMAAFEAAALAIGDGPERVQVVASASGPAAAPLDATQEFQHEDSTSAGTERMETAAGPGLDAATLAELAHLFVAFAHGTDGVLTNAEMRALAGKLRDWSPQLPLEQIGASLKRAVSDYTGMGAAARKERTQAARAQLAGQLDHSQRATLLTDLRAIAGADGKVSAAEQQFIDATAESLQFAPDPRLEAAAFIFLSLGSIDDDAIDPEEMRVLAEQLRQWVPGASLAETGEVLRRTVAEYRRLGSREARLDRARACADQLRTSTDKDTLRRILSDLWRIAGVDGEISADEQRFIMEMVERFGTAS